MTSYPALLDLADLRLHPVGAKDTFSVGRRSQADLPLLDLTCSRTQFKLVRESEATFVEAESTSTTTLINGDPITGRRRLQHGDTIQAGKSAFRYLERQSEETPPIEALATINAAEISLNLSEVI